MENKVSTKNAPRPCDEDIKYKKNIVIIESKQVKLEGVVKSGAPRP